MNTLVFGLLVTAIGVGIVFVGLVVLIGLIKIISLATANMGKKKEKKSDKPASAPQPATAPVAAPVAEEAPAADDGALIAVITAAIAAMMDDSSAFVVRKVRRVSNVPAWGKAGREEQVYSRF